MKKYIGLKLKKVHSVPSSIIRKRFQNAVYYKINATISTKWILDTARNKETCPFLSNEAYAQLRRVKVEEGGPVEVPSLPTEIQ